MTEQKPPVDLADLAKKLMDLWQDQLAALTTDADVAKQMARLSATMLRMPTEPSQPADHPFAGNPFAAWNPFAGAGAWQNGQWPGGAPAQAGAGRGFATDAGGMQRARQSTSGQPVGGQQPDTASAGTASAGPAAATAASRPEPGELEQLRARLAQLELRLAALEGSGGDTAPRTKRSSRKSKNASAGTADPAGAGAGPARPRTTDRRSRSGSTRKGAD